MHIDVDTFSLGTSDEKARKVCEESTEFYAEHARFIRDCRYPPTKDGAYGLHDLCLEIGDVFTALANYCAANNIDAQYCVDLAQTKNIVRGYYDKQ